ncbi:MAG TPA: hypothetical protein VFQ31_09730, partial [Methyloceanibacter sp.]|nr:hypothetical protein [Methyloceanibacter sp.]
TRRAMVARRAPPPPWQPKGDQPSSQGMRSRSFMRSAHDTEISKRLPSIAWLAVMILSAAILTYGTFVVLNLVGLR